MGERPWRAWQDWTKGRRALEMCWSKARRDAGRVVSKECERKKEREGEKEREREKVKEREKKKQRLNQVSVIVVQTVSTCEEIRKCFFACTVSSPSTSTSS
jgi:hypothetical protein